MSKIRNFIMILFMIFFCCFPILTKAIDLNHITVTQEENRITVRNIGAVGDQKSTINYQNQYMEERYNKYIKVLTFITAIATITMIGVFIAHIIKFAATGTEHWIVRRNAMFGLLWSGIATALLGSATLIMALAFNVFSLN